MPYTTDIPAHLPDDLQQILRDLHTSTTRMFDEVQRDKPPRTAWRFILLTLDRLNLLAIASLSRTYMDLDLQSARNLNSRHRRSALIHWILPFARSGK